MGIKECVSHLLVIFGSEFSVLGENMQGMDIFKFSFHFNPF